MIHKRPIPAIETSMQARFWAKVDKRGPDECWLWMGATKASTDSHIYGVWQYSGWNWMAHRIAYTLAVGPIPEELTLDHVYERGCRDTLCCNPNHLEPVTQSVNSQRTFTKSDRLYPLTCKRGHAKEFGRKTCRKCNVLAVARTQRGNPGKYLPMKREQKRRERNRT